MARAQVIVGIGAASGIASMIAATTALYRCWPLGIHTAGLAGRMAFTLQVDALAAIPMLLAIIVVANGRFLTEAIDPTLHKESAAAEINGRVADNTTQQFVLFVAATLALCPSLSNGELKIVPAAAAVFVVARFAFWIGYRINPLYRAFGMAATIYLSLGLLGFALWRAAAGWAAGSFPG